MKKQNSSTIVEEMKLSQCAEQLGDLHSNIESLAKAVESIADRTASVRRPTESLEVKPLTPSILVPLAQEIRDCSVSIEVLHSRLMSVLDALEI